MVAKREAPQGEKRKAEPTKEEPKKELKTDEAKAEGKPPAIVPEKEEEKEKEKDAREDTRPAAKETLGFDAADTTLNVMPMMGGQMLMSLTQGGMQYLIAGARANMGVKAGRYMFEVKIIEALSPQEGGQGGKKAVTPKQLIRVGFSTPGSSLILGDGGEESVCFDSEGFLLAGKSKKQCMLKGMAPFGKEYVYAVVLNLDSKSPNANTVSLFRDGVRASEPQAIPEALHGKPLHPHVSYRNVSVQVNFGATPMKPLPFKCWMLQGAAKSDLTAQRSSEPKGGKYDVMLPVAFPDEGTFDWLDDFLKKNPTYTELSDRKIIEWAQKSGMWTTKGNNPAHNSADKPEFNFGVPLMDDLSARKVINAVAPVVPRNYVVMEVRGNLLKKDRAEVLKRFRAPHYKCMAQVVMGEPTSGFKEMMQDRLLEEKQLKADRDFKVKKAELERKKAQAARMKQQLEQRKKAAEAKKAAEKKDGDEEKKDEDEEKKDEEDAPMEEDLEPAVVELTEDEKKQWFRQKPCPDLSRAVLEQAFGDFTIPSTKEGFADVKFEWQDEKKSTAYLMKYVQEKKVMSRVDDLQPSAWFKEKNSAYLKAISDWQSKQKAFKAAQKGKEKKEDGEDEDEQMNIDVMSLEDVCDMGNGEPLFSKFDADDWALMTLRYELYLLVHAYKKDVNDSDRIGIHESNFMFYYTKYYHKQMAAKAYGLNSHQDVVELVKDVATIDPSNHILTAKHEEDFDTPAMFAKLTEKSRRERQRRIDAGDETVKLKFNMNLLQSQQAIRQKKHWGKAGGGK